MMVLELLFSLHRKMEYAFLVGFWLALVTVIHA